MTVREDAITDVMGIVKVRVKAVVEDVPDHAKALVKTVHQNDCTSINENNRSRSKSL